MNKKQSVKTILLVEDAALISAAEVQTIGRLGYEVIAAISGEEAVTLSSGDEYISLTIMVIDPV
jgi:response regulator RpfG family c-di-GMP phosphodiesterase